MAEDKVEFAEMTQSSYMEAKLNSRGFWDVKQTLKQGRRVNSESEWENREVTMQASAKNVDVALAEVFLSMEGFLVARNHDLFNEPERGETPARITSSDGELLN